MTWTNVPKPTGTPYTRVTLVGKQQYDDPSITYDEATVYYDSVNQTAWTDVAKPTGNVSYTVRTHAGMATGLLMPLTYSSTMTASFTKDQWTRVSKPT